MTENDPSLEARAALVGLEIRKREGGWLLLHRQGKDVDAAYRCSSLEKVGEVITRFETKRR